MDSARELKSDVLNPENKYVSCPYNPSHRILRARLQYHLVKCRRNVKEKPEEEKVICPLDATHHINKEELAEHMKVCPNRKIVDSERYLIDSEVPEPASSYNLPEMPPCEENWDDPNEPTFTYDPTPHLENQPILRTMHGATKSERKAFRQVERMKMIQFQSGKPMDTAAAAAAAGVTITNGKFQGCGRGQYQFPLGRGLVAEDGMKGNNKLNLDKIVREHVVTTNPGPVEGPLRPAREKPIALRLAECTMNGDNADEPRLPESNPPLLSGKASYAVLTEKSQGVGVTSGFGVKKPTNADSGKNSQNDWWDLKDNSSTKGFQGNGTSVNLEEYKEKVKETQLAAKMGLITDDKADDDMRARDFTYLDDGWQVQGRRGRVMRGSPHVSASSGAISKRRW